MSERARRWVVFFAALAAAGLAARLGVWQLDRAAQKIGLQHAIDDRAALPPLAEPALARSEAEAAGQLHRRIELAGEWLAGATVFLDNRQMDGRPGFYVVTPLRLGDGSAVVVQRGWVPRDPADRTRLPSVESPAGAVQVRGRIAPPPSRLYSFGGPDTGTIRQNLDLVAYAAETHRSLRPVSIVEEAEDAAAPRGGPDVLRRNWPLPAVDVSRHYGYAFQWFALSALVAGLYVWFQLVRPRRRAA